MKLKKNKIFLGVGLVTFILLTLFIVNKPNAKPLNTNIDESKTINKDNNSIAMYIIDGEEETKIDQIPEEGNYVLNDKSYCKTKDSDDDKTITIDYVDKKINISNITKKGTKCYIYFEKQKSPSEQTLAKLEIKSTKPLDSDNLTGPSCDADLEKCYSNNTAKNMQQNGVYEVKDQDGNSSYVYRGTVNNNWLKFGGFWWRIIRVNGNGSLRVIYAGTVNGDSDTNPSTTGSTTQIGTSAFNSAYNNNMYVGFKYTSGTRQGYGTSSTILGDDKNPTGNTLNKWYKDNIEDKRLKDYIEKDEIFCNDRSSSTSNTTNWSTSLYEDYESSKAPNGSTGGTSTTTTYYGAYLRMLPKGSWGKNQQATLMCDSEDQFSASETVGNGKLVNPIGLITADEVLLAGGFGGQNNTSYWLYTGSTYWTMSPCLYPGARVFVVDDNGRLSGVYVDGAWGVRPVLNLKTDTLKVRSGDSATVGTPSNAYTIGQ